MRNGRASPWRTRSAVAPTVEALAPLTCADPFVEAKVDGSPVVANYPLIAQSLHQTGTATIKIVVGADGIARDATVYATSGYHELDLAAVVAALQTRYRSRLFRCVPVSTAVLFVSGFEPR